MKFTICIFTVSFIFYLAAEANAQKAIFNGPTADVLDKCKDCVEHDPTSVADDHEAIGNSWDFARPRIWKQNFGTFSNAPVSKTTDRKRFIGSALSGSRSGFAPNVDGVNEELRPLFDRVEWQTNGNPFSPIYPGSTGDIGGSMFDNMSVQDGSSEEQQTQQSDPKWQYGGFVDLAYMHDFNNPANRLFRSRGTAFRVNRVHLNMAGFYVRREATEESRWGGELTVHAGKDAEVFGFSATAPNIPGYKFLRQLGPTNVSYLAPVGKGLKIQAGIFSSLIGYDSLYAKDNFNYTRPWGADFTPYFMMGANASYPFNEKLTVTAFVVNGYWHLARANNVPSAGGQVAYKLTPKWTLKETVLFGPHQRNTAFGLWRFLTDTIVERKTDKVTFAFEYTTSWERVDAAGRPLALMMSSQFPLRWKLADRWSLSLRPEVFWDRDGRWTLARQTVKAFTTTLEYRVPVKWTNTIFRVEHRVDDSRGPEGGFFSGPEVSPSVIALKPTRHQLAFATIFTFDR